MMTFAEFHEVVPVQGYCQPPLTVYAVKAVLYFMHTVWPLFPVHSYELPVCQDSSTANPPAIQEMPALAAHPMV